MRNSSKRRFALCAALLAAMGLGTAVAARADINVGVILSLTGPGASLGKPEEETIRLWPGEIAGQKLNVTILNDSTDPTAATVAARKLVTEQKVDIIVGPSLTPPSLAVLQVAAEHELPLISLAGGGVIVEPVEGPRRWAFKMSPTENIATARVFDHMKGKKARKLGVIAVATGYGEGYLKVIDKLAPKHGIEVVAVERYQPGDQSVTGQIVKILGAKPDAVFVVSFGTPGVTPQIELNRRGYKGLVYQTQGIANNDFLRLGGKDVEGTYVTVAPVLVAEQLSPSNPVRKVSLDYVQKFEAKYGAGSRSLFGGSAWDAFIWLEHAIPSALKRAKPGTREFRAALRDGLEGMKNVAGVEGVFNMSPTDHNGVDESCQVMVRIQNGKWKLVDE